MNPTLALSPSEEAEVKVILAAHLPPEVRVGVFGSRATGHAKQWSDLDLALSGPGPISLVVMAALAEAFEGSHLPWKVDLVDLACVSPESRDVIVGSLIPLR